MKKTRFMLNLVSVVGLVGCTLVAPTGPTLPADQFPTSPQLPTVILNTQTPAAGAPVTPLLTVELLQNSTYTVPYYLRVVNLTNGQYEGGTGNDYLKVSLLQVALGDLNGDGTSDAAILLAENGGGSGTFVNLIVILDQNGSLVQVNSSQLIDDRPVIQSLNIQDARIIFKGLIHGPNDTQVAPTLAVTQTYRFTQGNLWLSRLVQLNQDGSEHSIDISSPAFGSEVSQHVQIKGSMPAAPFENTLGYIISDSSGSQLDKDSFMVESVDVGAPATFDHTFDLSAIPSGTVIRISLFEGDMSGHSDFRVLDAVELTVK